jgi:penicillin-binding protein 2
VNCIGHFYPDKPLLYRCWIYKQRNTTHNDQLGHALDGSDAIKVSCNIFFFEMGRRLGPSGIADWYRKFGVGEGAEAWNIFGLEGGPAKTGLLHEFGGKVGGSGGETTGPEAVLMGIGQGPIVWTPLHAADAYATLARGGMKVTPRLRTDAVQKRTDLGLNAKALRKSLDGLKRSANEENGTTFQMVFDGVDGEKTRERVFTQPGVDVWAKSGTADAPPFVADLNFDQNAETFDGDHAWCVALAGSGGQPKYAIAVVVDHGGSGGRVAGPVVNQVIGALVSEGYLPDQRGLMGAGGFER